MTMIMIPPPFTMTIDVGPQSRMVISGTSLYNIAEKLNKSPLGKGICDRIKIAMSGKIGGFPLGQICCLLDGMVTIESIYPQEWTTGNKMDWWKSNIASPPSVFYELQKC